MLQLICHHRVHVSQRVRPACVYPTSCLLSVTPLATREAIPLSTHMCVAVLCALQELEEEYDKARGVLKDALRAANWIATPDSTYTDYLEALSGGDGSKAAAAAAAGKAEGGEGGEDAAAAAADGAAAAADGGDGDTAMADAEAGKGISRGSEKGGGLDAELAAKVAAIRDSHKRVYFEEQVRSYAKLVFFESVAGIMMHIRLSHLALCAVMLERPTWFQELQGMGGLVSKVRVSSLQ